MAATGDVPQLCRATDHGAVGLPRHRSRRGTDAPSRTARQGPVEARDVASSFLSLHSFLSLSRARRRQLLVAPSLAGPLPTFPKLLLGLVKVMKLLGLNGGSNDLNG